MSTQQAHVILVPTVNVGNLDATLATDADCSVSDCTQVSPKSRERCRSMLILTKLALLQTS